MEAPQAQGWGPGSCAWGSGMFTQRARSQGESRAPVLGCATTGAPLRSPLQRGAYIPNPVTSASTPLGTASAQELGGDTKLHTSRGCLQPAYSCPPFPAFCYTLSTVCSGDRPATL